MFSLYHHIIIITVVRMRLDMGWRNSNSRNSNSTQQIRQGNNYWPGLNKMCIPNIKYNFLYEHFDMLTAFLPYYFGTYNHQSTINT